MCAWGRKEKAKMMKREREREEEKERRGRVCVIGKYPRSLLVNDRYAKL